MSSATAPAALSGRERRQRLIIARGRRLLKDLRVVVRARARVVLYAECEADETRGLGWRDEHILAGGELRHESIEGARCRNAHGAIR